MKQLRWFDRKFTFGLSPEMLPFYLERLGGTRARIEDKVKGVDDKFLSERFNDKWSIKQHIGHLAEVDEIGNRRIDEMISGFPVLSPAVFEPKDYSSWPFEKVVYYFEKTRSDNIKKYNGLSEDELVRGSEHPRLKVNMTPVDLAWFDAEHDDHHLLTIQQILNFH